MALKSLFSAPFDDGTKAKLEIFRLYLREWLPVFISSYDKKYWDSIYIYDFFAGEGKDTEDNYGSPLVILDVLNEYAELVNKTKVKIKIILNEKDEEIFNKLQINIGKLSYNKNKIDIKFFNQPFKDLFEKYYTAMLATTEFPKLMFLDQYGIKEITNDVFKKLISFKRTDFIFFISSSFIRRFNEMEEFKSYISLNKEDFNDTKPFHSHRVVFEYYKSLINTDYKLAPFSIKKGKNIYGLIFGSNHSLGLEKFLKVAWKINPHTGDANYNIDEELIISGQIALFEEFNTIKKIAHFENKIKEEILQQKLKTLWDCYLFTLEFGCQPKHCNTVIYQLVKDNKIDAVRTVSEKIHKLAPPNNIKLVLK